MAGLLKRLHFVRMLPRRSADAALIAAMGVCGAEEADVIAAELLERDSARASTALIGAVVRAWGRLSDAAREATALAAGKRMDGIVESLVRAGDARSQQTAARVEAWRAGRGEVSQETITRLTTMGVTDTRGIGDVARGALTRLSKQTASLGERERAALDAGMARIASAALVHGDSAFMTSVAELAQAPGPMVAAWLNARGEAGHGMVRAAARKVLARAADPVGLACSWLRYAAVERPAALYLEELFESGQGDRVVMCVDLLGEQNARGAMRKWCRADRLVPNGDVLAGWPTEARARVAAWLEVLGIRDDRRVAALEMLLLDRAAAVRMSAALALARMTASPRVDEALFKAARDEDERVSIAAIEALGSAQSARRRGVIAPVLGEIAARGGMVREAAERALSRFASDDGVATTEVRVRSMLGGVRR